MIKKAEFLERQGDPSANPEFLLEYQRAVLRSLQENGILTSEQMADCISLLVKQCH
ncbi:hypothetical protein [Oscillibacter sp.]|uniref:hypothetical protein n=1 Tax=Oscillibacter sp. TaxID=1945593 RepID=UPI0026347A33|nr:hypothetical protein [Oscillibacter sp.]MDD3346481.1 hypothetical protein [Oscillibacter sp.]